MENESVMKKAVRDFSKTADIIQTLVIFLVALIVPTFLGQLLKIIFPATSIVVTKSQLIIGSIVNTALIIAALNFKGWTKILGVITMPSIATVFSGYVFSTASTLMSWMIPGIWIGNFVLVFVYKFFYVSKKRYYFLVGIVGTVLKAYIIFGSFYAVKLFGVFPDKMIPNLSQAMGMTQVITATIGMFLAFLIYKIEMKK